MPSTRFQATGVAGSPTRRRRPTTARRCGGRGSRPTRRASPRSSIARPPDHGRRARRTGVLRVQRTGARAATSTSTRPRRRRARARARRARRRGRARSATPRCPRAARRCRSQTAHQATGSPPIRALRRAQHHVRPEGADYVQRFSGRPPRSSGMRSGRTGRHGRDIAGAPRLTDESIRGKETHVRAAAVQLTSTADRERNLATADRLTRAAAAAGAELVVLPEKWPVLGTPEQTAAAAEPFDGPALRWARAIARELGIDLVAGSFAERVPGAREGRNTSRARRARRRAARDLPQDPHVRRRGRRARLPRVRARGAGRRDRALGDRRRHRARADASATTCASPSSTGSSPCAARA